MSKEFIVEGMDLQYEQSGYNNLTIHLRTAEVPKDLKDISMIFCNQYLASKGIKKTINEVIEEHYPENLI